MLAGSHTSSVNGPEPKASSNKDDKDGDTSLGDTGTLCTPKVHTGQQEEWRQGWSLAEQLCPGRAQDGTMWPWPRWPGEGPPAFP